MSIHTEIGLFFFEEKALQESIWDFMFAQPDYDKKPLKLELTFSRD